MCVREGVTAGTTTQSCKCWHNGQRGRRGGRRKDEARTARSDPQITPGFCSASAEPPSGRLEGGWRCMFLTRSCRPTEPSYYQRSGMKELVAATDVLLPRWGVAYLVRDLTPVTGELVEWLPLLTEPGSPLSGGLQYVVRFAPLLPPAMADTLSSPLSAFCLLLWSGTK